MIAHRAAEDDDVLLRNGGQQLIHGGRIQFLLHRLAAFGQRGGDFRAEDFRAFESVPGNFHAQWLDHFTEEAGVSDHGSHLLRGRRAVLLLRLEGKIERRHLRLFQKRDSRLGVLEEILRQLRAVIAHERCVQGSDFARADRSGEGAGQAAHLEVSHPAVQGEEMTRLLAGGFPHRQRELAAEESGDSGGLGVQGRLVLLAGFRDVFRIDHRATGHLLLDKLPDLRFFDVARDFRSVIKGKDAFGILWQVADEAQPRGAFLRPDFFAGDGGHGVLDLFHRLRNGGLGVRTLSIFLLLAGPETEGNHGDA